MRRAILILAVCLCGCDEGGDGAALTDNEICLEAFDCGMACEYPADELAELGPDPGPGADPEESAAWVNAKGEITRAWETCVRTCGGSDDPGGYNPPEDPGPQWLGTVDAFSCAQYGREAQCSAERCDAFI